MTAVQDELYLWISGASSVFTFGGILLIWRTLLLQKRALQEQSQVISRDYEKYVYTVKPVLKFVFVDSSHEYEGRIVFKIDNHPAYSLSIEPQNNEYNLHPSVVHQDYFDANNELEFTYLRKEVDPKPPNGEYAFKIKTRYVDILGNMYVQMFTILIDNKIALSDKPKKVDTFANT